MYKEIAVDEQTMTLIEISRQLGHLQGLIESDHADHKAIWQELVDLRRTVDESSQKLDSIGDVPSLRENSELITAIRKKIITIATGVGLLSFASGAANGEKVTSAIHQLIDALGGIQ